MHHSNWNPITLEQNVGGPLKPYVVSYATLLQAEGYTQDSGRMRIRLVADFSRWLEQKGIAAEEIVAQNIIDFLRYRKRRGLRPEASNQTALSRLLRMLRDQGVITPQPPQRAPTPIERTLEEYDDYLKKRDLSLRTRDAYRPYAQQFLTVQFKKGPLKLPALRAPDITRFVRSQAARQRGQHILQLTSALRSFLRFLHYREDITLDLAACVPAVASWSFSALPKYLLPTQVEEVLRHCNRQTAIGRRDYAILLLLARLGLRAGEVAGLTLDDIDWESGSITVQGKGGRSSQLPLPADVGKAVVAYLKSGRPNARPTRHVFLHAKAPVGDLITHHVVGNVVKRALARASIDTPRKGAHQFRHSLATEMLRKGASLREIGEILRHQSPQTTAIYAKVDLVSLRSLALPWPGGVR